MVSIWLHHNTRYPTTWTDEHERPSHDITGFDGLRRLLTKLES